MQISMRQIRQYDVLSPEYLAALRNKGIKPTQRDELIAEVLAFDEMQKEIIRRAVIEESRLDVLMKILGYRVAPHHMAFIKFMLGCRARGIKRGMLLGPRGCGKSTACNICDSIMLVLQDPDTNILIASRTADQAKAFLSAIKGNLVKPQFVELFGDLKGEKWDETAIDIAGREPGPKEHTFHIAGADGAVVSKHFRVIKCDDLVEEKNAKTESARSTVMKFFYKSMMPCLRPGGELWVYGTRYHPDDIYGHLKENDPNFKNAVMIFPAVFDKDTGESVDLEQKEDGAFAVPENAIVWDEEGFSSVELCARRQGMTHGDFAAQYQNEIDVLRGDYFDSDDFQYYTETPEALVRSYDLRVWMGVDLAASEKTTADEFAIVVVGVEPKSLAVYVLDFFSGRLSFIKQKEMLVEMYDRWDPVRSFVESNAYQAVMQSTTVEEFPDIRVLPLYTTQDKITRAMALSVYYERHQIYHRKGRMAKLEGQLTGFPHLKLKDLFDALYFAVWGAVRGGRRRSRRTKEPGLF